MKKKFLALILALLLIPGIPARAAQPGWAESRMDSHYAVIGGDQSITIRSHAEPGGRGGYSEALYAVELTGAETKEQLDAIAVELVTSGAEPVWYGGLRCFHIGSFTADPAFTLKADAYAPGSYLYVCYAFGCTGSYNHDLTPYYERISTMSVRITREARPMELRYALTDGTGAELSACEDGGTLELDLNGPGVFLSLDTGAEYPVEQILSMEPAFDQEHPAFRLDPETLELEPLLCGSGSITVTIGNYLDDSTRTETIFLSVPCAPMPEPTVLAENTCTEDGLAVYQCHGHGVQCETTFDEVVLPATGHSLFPIRQYLQKPTATLPGIGLGTCRTCGLIGVEQEVPAIFSDVDPDDFYSRPLDYCHGKGWVNGVTADTFAPSNSCQRSQVVTFLWRAAGCPRAESSVNPFEDVKETDFYYDAVLWAVESGITTGTDAAHFSPGGICSRSQVVTFLWRAFGQPESTSESHSFADVKAGSWYEPAVLWAVENGITSGMGPATFAPDATCNRAQIVTFLYRAYAE